MLGIKEQQAANFTVMRKELKARGINRVKFADSIGVTKETVTYWTSGKYHIRLENAEVIHRVYPEYPVAWLMGQTDARNQHEEFAIALLAAHDRKEARELLLDCLAYLSGWKVEEPKRKHDANVEDVFSKSDKYVERYCEKALEEALEHAVDLTRDGQSIPLSMEQRKTLIDKMVALFELEITHRF